MMCVMLCDACVLRSEAPSPLPLPPPQERGKITCFARDLDDLRNKVTDLEEGSRNLCSCFLRMKAKTAFKTQVRPCPLPPVPRPCT